MKSAINIIGSGFSSLAAASYLAKGGFEVKVFEKNAHIGGRARQLERDGFKFDMGPTWYWMPDVFERFFNDLGKAPSDYYTLKRLTPAYKVFYEGGKSVTIPDNIEDIYTLFENEEKGSSTVLKKFLKDAKYNYNVAIKDLVYKPGLSAMELITPKTVGKLNQFFTTIGAYVDDKFKNERLQQVLKFPVLFLGAKPENTPLFYNFMNYADLILGTWFPEGGMYSVVSAMKQLAEELGVEFRMNSNVESILIENGKSRGLVVNGKEIRSDFVLSGADYAHTESLMPVESRGYSKKYWEKKTFAPSALLFYVGFDEKLDNIEHHTLFFDEDFDTHSKAIYDDIKWPEKPLFYASFPSKGDPSLAPEGKEAAIFLVPLAPGLEDSEAQKRRCFEQIMDRLEKATKQDVKSKVLFSESFSINDFKNDYNSYKGNAYGMANTLLQTAFLRPKIKSKKVKGLYFTGQLTVPGPGVPPSLISGKIAADLIQKECSKKQIHESSI